MAGYIVGNENANNSKPPQCDKPICKPDNSEVHFCTSAEYINQLMINDC
jgi:hypothetical protein